MEHWIPAVGTRPRDRVEAAGVQWRRLAENVYYMPGHATVKRLVDGWMRSPGHRRNILLPDLTHAGFGEAGDYYTQVFARIEGTTHHPTRHHHVVAESTPEVSRGVRVENEGRYLRVGTAYPGARLDSTSQADSSTTFALVTIEGYNSQHPIVALRSTAYDGVYVRVTPQGEVETQNFCNAQEHFELIDQLQYGGVALRSLTNGKYLAFQPDGTITAKQDHIWNRQLLHLL